MAASYPVATNASGKVTSREGVYRGFSARETTNAAGAVFRLHDGASAAGPLLETVSLGAGESAREWYVDEDGGIVVNDGIFFELVAGAFELAVRA